MGIKHLDLIGRPEFETRGKKMIVNQHPVLKLLDEFPGKFHLIGSRYVGVFDAETSDYDFILECTHQEWYNVKIWLDENGFVPNGTSGYGPDRYLHGSNVWTNKVYENFPSVDVFPMSPEEADMRLNFFALMKELGHTKGGLLAKSLKQGKTWPNLWECIRQLNKRT